MLFAGRALSIHLLPQPISSTIPCRCSATVFIVSGSERKISHWGCTGVFRKNEKICLMMRKNECSCDMAKILPTLGMSGGETKCHLLARR